MGEKSKNRSLNLFINMVRIMEKFHWSYTTYLQTPKHVLVNILNYLNTEEEVQQKQNGQKHD